MKINFAGCARDCADVLVANISALLAIGDMPWCDELRIYVVENSSVDNTRDIILHLADHDPRIIPVLLEDLDEVMPTREARIAFCRDRLLDEICKNQSDGLYVPIDLDSNIAFSLDADAFLKACQLVASGQCSGAFPSSRPYYYDIYALRKADWCPGNCWEEINDSNTRGALLNLLATIRYVSLRQKRYEKLLCEGLIPINSAFGGVGIYTLASIHQSGARYSSPLLEVVNKKLCEHVIFNAFFCDLFIIPDWIITAPPEHIKFRSLSYYRICLRLMQAGIEDLNRLPFVISSRFKRHIIKCIGD